MPEVNTSFEQLLHCDRGHWPPFLKCIRVVDASARIDPAFLREIGKKQKSVDSGQ
jgi:hypothetical protein